MAFFTIQELSKKATVDTSESSLALMKGNCDKCKACESTLHPFLSYSGEGRKKILVVSDFPSHFDDRDKTHFSGEWGELLQEYLNRHGIHLYRDCWRINAHRCLLHPAATESNTKQYVIHCQQYLKRVVLETRPEYILLLGTYAITGFYYPHFSGSGEAYSPERWRGFLIPDQEYKAIVSCTYHPRTLLMNPEDKAYEILFSKDISRFCACINNNDIKDFEQINYDNYVKILNLYPDVVSLFERIIKNKLPITFDYETTGLKPFSNGHKVGMVGIALSETEAYCVPLQWPNTWTEKEYRKIEELWKEILSNKEIKKSNHNILFEDVWSYGIFATRLSGVEWDTQLGAHIIDNRRAFTGLKFQTYLYFGVLSYDEHIKPYLSSERKVSEFNNLFKAPYKELATYCALDCIFSRKLMQIQKKFFLNPKHSRMYEAFRFYMKGIRVMSELQINGVSSDLNYFVQKDKEVQEKVKIMEEELLNGEEAQRFFDVVKRKMKLTGKDIGILLYNVLGYTGEQTEKGNWKVDKVTLGRLKSSFSEKYNSLQKFNKIHNSFLSNFIYYTCEDKRIHGSFGINNVISYRSSATDPNMQNMSKRDQEGKQLLRTGFLPDEDSVIVEADFSGAEVNVSASTHGDRNFIRYLTDPDADMHADEACSVFRLEHDDLRSPDFNKEQKALAKKVRNAVKGKWVFAQFYGDWYKSCAKSLWEDVKQEEYILPSGQPLIEHMQESGIGNLESFTEHCKDAEQNLWYVRFPDYTQWKKDIYNFYLKNGYIENFFGFRFQGYLNRKTATNYPIQSVSFQLLVEVLIRMSNFLRKERMCSKLIAQIHDSCVASVRLDELDKFIKFFNGTVCSLHERHKWMKVPMAAEFEVSKPAEQGGNLAKMYEVPEHMLSGHIDLPTIYTR